MAEEAGKSVNDYRPLYIAALKGDWESAKRIFDNDSKAVIAEITYSGGNALHIAAMEGHSEFVEKLVELMPKEALEMQDTGSAESYTALHYVAVAGSTKAAEAIVQKNPATPQIASKTGATPLLFAARGESKTKEEMLRYLSSVTTDDEPGRPFTGPHAGLLITTLAYAGFHDITLGIVQRYPNLATEWNGWSCLLTVLAESPLDFESGSRLGFWERCIYPYVPVKVNCTSTDSVKSESTYKVLDWLKGICWKALLGFTGVKKVCDTKLTHQSALQLVKLVIKQVSLMENAKADQFLGWADPIGKAALYGTVEVIKEVLGAFPDIFWSGQQLRIAIEARQENVYSLFNALIARNQIGYRWNMNSHDNILFQAANLAPDRQLSSVPGAALQLQSELQWFKEVEKLIIFSQRMIQNVEKKTAREVFTEKHKDLKEKGETWMKDTANSCTLVAALIATVVFTAAFTVPGGNDGDKGIPIFLQQKSFMIFIVSDALSFFASSTSILMFLSILTARYAEEDFLVSLPKRMIIGLTSLFFAMATMMIAFAAALEIVLGDKISWIAIPVTVLAAFPVAMFVMLQLPLFVEMVKSTYGKRFRPQRIW